MLSSNAPVTPPAGADLTRTTSRRQRGLSYLRALSHNRSSGGNSPNEPSRSPRHYFQRSLSYNDNRPASAGGGRRRSVSRPNEPTSLLPTEPRPLPGSQGNSRPTTPAEKHAAASHAASASSPGREGGAAQNNADGMARHGPSARRRTTGSHPPTDVAAAVAAAAVPMPLSARSKSSSATKADASEPDAKPQLPAIRFFAHQENRNGRPSLTFAPISRTLPNEHAVIRVGRYSEREGVPVANPATPSDAPVGFKSKVVSRKHCEFSFLDGQWQIKDVASSSGTFLNHIRLSQPNTESRLFPIKDGDIVQLGIDFRGGEEVIFRCVKIRIECNRAWQKKPNNFNKSRHQQLQSLAKDQPSADTNSGECSICLGPVLPCQALFVAPCAHVWHYKCIRPLLEGKNSTYPQFQCPNCRAYSDLTADVDIAQSDIDEWMENTDDPDNNATSATEDAPPDAHQNADLQINGQVTGEPEPTTTPTDETGPHRPAAAEPVPATPAGPATATSETPDESHASAPLRSSGLLARRQAANPASPELHSMNANIEMPLRQDEDDLTVQLDQQRTRTQTPDPEQVIAGEGPLTPRNNAGPFVFDGSAGRSDARPLVVPGIPEVAQGSDPAS